MRILKPGEPCPCCWMPIRDDLPRWKLLLLSYIAEGLSLMDAINALAEVMEFLPPTDGAEVPDEMTMPDPKPDAPAPAPTEAEEKREILQRLKDYRAANGLGSFSVLSMHTARRKDSRLSEDLLRDICAGTAPKMEIADWRKITRALDKLEEEAHG